MKRPNKLHKNFWFVQEAPSFLDMKQEKGHSPIHWKVLNAASIWRKMSRLGECGE